MSQRTVRNNVLGWFTILFALMASLAFKLRSRFAIVPSTMAFYFDGLELAVALVKKPVGDIAHMLSQTLG